MTEVLDEERRFEDFDSPMSPNPYSPWRVARQLAVPEAVPFLISVLEGKHPGTGWALEALDALGPAARAASPQVERLGEMLTLWSIDEARARAFAVHLHAGTWRSPIGVTARHAIARRAMEAGPQVAREHFIELLDNTDVEVLRFALDGVPSDSSCLYELAWEQPDAVPIEAVRPYVHHNNHKVAAAAARILMVLNRAVDAGPVIDVAARIELPRINFNWLAPHPRSYLLYERATIRETFEIVRRRRCANLPPQLPEHLRGGERSLHDKDDRVFAPRLDAELAGKVLAPTTSDAADDRFLKGQLQDYEPDAGAYGHYARVLLAQPTHVHAAFQLAWIDRLYGSPITPERIAWLRELGISDEALLAEVGTPLASPLCGKRAAATLAPGTQDEALAHLSRVWNAVKR